LIDDVGFSANSYVWWRNHHANLRWIGKAGPSLQRVSCELSLLSYSRSSAIGRNNHEVGFGTVAEAASGYPGYNAQWGKNAVSLAEVLKSNAYSTAAFGKWIHAAVGDNLCWPIRSLAYRARL